ncbi:MAG TPA: restriction endonuclease [Thermosulfurimonas dismutans]|uniref:Restriction endonuclease n=1 Tax=Thermosulfurimonas dismutans TaxID=999894 RepID=A0A7C3CSR9_9BACT|nr:restriction endonuclease [Thermosulfurimonas dismutans]
MNLESLRREFLKEIFSKIVVCNTDGVPNFADKHSASSIVISKKLLEILGLRVSRKRSSSQTVGRIFEEAVRKFLEKALEELDHLRSWPYRVHLHRKIWDFSQYRHLRMLNEAFEKYPELKTSLGRDYFIAPDIVVSLEPLEDELLNRKTKGFVSGTTARLSPIRRENSSFEILHAVISCKWTIRSDRAQNARAEALTLVQKRKGRSPHLVVVLAEPLPSRIASLAFGTGEIDMTYHVCLYELKEAVKASGIEDQVEILEMLISGNRLRDISDLPLDLQV